MIKVLSEQELVKIRLVDRLISAYNVEELAQMVDGNEVLSTIRDDNTGSTYLENIYTELLRLSRLNEELAHENAELTNIVKDLAEVLVSENPLSYNLQSVAGRLAYKH